MGIKIDKSLLRASNGRPITQSLFLENGYNTDLAVFTLKDDDYEYEGKVYYSLKRLYLEHEDVGEYDFSYEYLLGWDHWQKISSNKLVQKHVERWREELEYKIRSQAIRTILTLDADGNFQAAKWLADKGWDKKSVGRPTKASKSSEADFEAQLEKEYGAEITRLY